MSLGEKNLEEFNSQNSIEAEASYSDNENFKSSMIDAGNNSPPNTPPNELIGTGKFIGSRILQNNDERSPGLILEFQSKKILSATKFAGEEDPNSEFVYEASHENKKISDEAMLIAKRKRLMEKLKDLAATQPLKPLPDRGRLLQTQKLRPKRQDEINQSQVDADTEQNINTEFDSETLDMEEKTSSGHEDSQTTQPQDLSITHEISGSFNFPEDNLSLENRRNSIGCSEGDYLIKELEPKSPKIMSKAAGPDYTRNYEVQLIELTQVSDKLRDHNLELKLEIDSLAQELKKWKLRAFKSLSLFKQLTAELRHAGVEVEIENIEELFEDDQFFTQGKLTDSLKSNPVDVRPEGNDLNSVDCQDAKLEKVSASDQKQPNNVNLSTTLSSIEKAISKVSVAEETEDDLAAAIVAENLLRTKTSLPIVSGFLQKRSPSVLRGWQRRYFFLRDYNLYYSQNEVESESNWDETSLDKDVLNVISLVVVQSIAAKNEPTVFEIKARDPRTGQMRTYILKADTLNDRDRWVRDLNTHREHLLSTLRWSTT